MFKHLFVILTVGYFGGWSVVDLVNTREWDILLSASDVWNVIEGPLWLEGPVH